MQIKRNFSYLAVILARIYCESLILIVICYCGYLTYFAHEIAFF